MTRVGLIGLGIMGRGMAANLLAKGFPLCVFNRTASKADAFVERGAVRAGSPAELAERSEIILSCVSDTPDVEAVLFGEGGVSERVAKGQLVVDLSTISPKKTREFADRFSAFGVDFLDAPVSGGSEGAERGTLSVMVGGSADALDRARPVLEAFGKSIVHVGPSGSGQLVKLVNQILVAGSMLSMAEGLLFAQASGLDLTKTLEVVTAGAANSWTLQNRGPMLARRDFRPGFTVDLQQKDLRLVLEAGDELGVPLQGTSTAFHYYRAVQQHGSGGDGNHALVKALELLSGITLGREQ
jgi:3-hydroxyisobutyrate dehydrogenase-like beta-hydroxyacid dehydrogenase